MFKRKTLFIVGAGASAEVDMPVGIQLAATVAKKVDIRFHPEQGHFGEGDRELFGTVLGGEHNLASKYQHAGWLIRDGVQLSQSIDDFLDLHRSNKLVQTYAKSAIVKCILEAESKSMLAYGHGTPHTRFDTSLLVNTWYVKFMHMLGRGVPKENASQVFDNVSFIIFNYDRCVEFFLTNAIEKLYGLETREAREMVAELDIIHPYGSISAEVPFGAKDQNYPHLAEKIKTYTEQQTNAEISNRLTTMVASAACIIFLGFAYHSQNLLILKPDEKIKIRPVYGTAFNMSRADVNVVKGQIASFFSAAPHPPTHFNQILLENELTSARLFDYYAKSLTGGD
jgi:hypothetical protein